MSGFVDMPYKRKDVKTMMIIPMSPNIHTLEAVDRAFNTQKSESIGTEMNNGETGTFLDAMLGLWNQAEQAQAQKIEDMMNLMLGDTENLEQIQVNITKAEIATELLVNVKNAVVEAYNEIIRMQV